MAVEIIMLRLDVDMQEGEITEWKKAEGEFVREGDTLLEIMSDKTNMEIETEDFGILLRVVYEAGDAVPVTGIIGYLGAEGKIIDEIVQMAPEQTVADPTAADLRASKAVTADVTSEQKTPPAADKYNMVVVGGGPASYYAAIRGAQLGGKTTTIEKSGFGGTRLDVGCVPTEAYLKDAEILDGLKVVVSRGIDLASTNCSIDMDKTVELKNSIVKTLTSGVRGLLEANKVTIFDKLARVNPDRAVTTGSQTIKGHSIILATGSKVPRTNIPGIDSPLVLTSDDIPDLREIPKSLAIVGSDVVEIELELIWASYGADVTVIEMADRIIPAMDKEISQELQKILTREGMTIETNVGIAEIVEGNSQLRLTLTNDEAIQADKAFLSIGRAPQMQGLESLNLDMEGDRIKVNTYQKTSISGIYAPGGVNGQKMLAYAAYRMGEVVAENALRGNRHKTDLIYIPAAVYTHSEVTMAGMTEEAAREQYGDILIGKSGFTGNGRALASNEAQGFVKVIADSKYHEVLDVHIIGPVAAELINEAATTMEDELTVDDVAQAIHGHPTSSEDMYEAFLDTIDEVIHNPPEK